MVSGRRRFIRTVEVPEVAIAGALAELSRRYVAVVPVSERNGVHQTQWIAERLVGLLRKDGWERVAEPGKSHNVLIEHGVQIPDHHVIPCRSAVHAVEVAERSSIGARAVWRGVGPWRDGDPAEMS